MKQPSRKNPKRMLTHFALAGMPAYERHQDHVFILGAITIQWSTTERLLFECFRHLLHLTRANAEAIYDAIPAFNARLTMLRELAGALVSASPTRGRILETLDEVESCAEKRNRLIHDTWMIDVRSGAVVRQRMGRVKRDREDVHRTRGGPDAASPEALSGKRLAEHGNRCPSR